MGVYTDDVQKIYIAYYGRPADEVGLSFWEGQLTDAGGDLGAIMDSFGRSSEFDSRFGGLSDSDLISNIYQQLFGRVPDAGGLQFYLEELQADRMTLQTIAIAILTGAQNNDLDIITNKITASTLFTSSLSNGTFEYAGSTAANSASDWLATIDASSTDTIIDSTFGFTGAPIPSTELATTRQYLAYDNQIDDDRAGLTLFDFNGDGLLDILTVIGHYLSFDSAPVEIALNNGDGTFTENTASIIVGDIPAFLHPREMVEADFNGDGVSDFFIAGHGYDADPFPGEANGLLLSNGDGTWSGAELPSIGTDFSHSAAAGDIDNDGDLDIYVGNLGGHTPAAYILVNDGVGGFTINSSILPDSIASVSPYTTSLFMDANNDGAVDLVLGGDQTTTNKIYLNQNGSFSDSAVINLPESTTFTSNIVVDSQVYDFNNDGYDDILFVSTKSDPFYEDNQIQILINDGNSGFADETDTYIPNYLHGERWGLYAHIVDVNNDGYVDILLEDVNTYYLNDGTGIFATNGELPVDLYSNIEVANIDSDEQLELVYETWQGYSVLDIL